MEEDEDPWFHPNSIILQKKSEALYRIKLNIFKCIHHFKTSAKSKYMERQVRLSPWQNRKMLWNILILASAIIDQIGRRSTLRKSLP